MVLLFKRKVIVNAEMIEGPQGLLSGASTLLTPREAVFVFVK